MEGTKPFMQYRRYEAVFCTFARSMSRLDGARNSPVIPFGPARRSWTNAERFRSRPTCSARHRKRQITTSSRAGGNVRAGHRPERVTQRDPAYAPCADGPPNPYWAGHVSGRRRRNAERPGLGARAVRQARVNQPGAPLRRLGGGRGPGLRAASGLCRSAGTVILFLAATRCLSVGAGRGGGIGQGSVRGRILPSPPA
jgi:hypothetical protein